MRPSQKAPSARRCIKTGNPSFDKIMGWVSESTERQKVH